MPSIREKTSLEQRLSQMVDDAVGRARLRGMLKQPMMSGSRMKVIDQLLAGSRTEQEIVGPGGLLVELTSGWWSARWRSS